MKGTKKERDEERAVPAIGFIPQMLAQQPGLGQTEAMSQAFSRNGRVGASLVFISLRLK